MSTSATIHEAADPPRNPLAAIRRFAKPTPSPAKLEKCELCAAPIGNEHDHLIELANHQLVCSCEACAILFGDQRAARYRRVPRQIVSLPDFRLDDLEWQSLQIPIGLAFFFHNSAAGRTMAYFPSPAGATESDLPAEAWQSLVEANPVLSGMQPDVEALLVHRIKEHREHYLAPIDHCYGLVGLIRKHWRGLSGGQMAWDEIERFFRVLGSRAHPPRGGSHA